MNAVSTSLLLDQGTLYAQFSNCSNDFLQTQWTKGLLPSARNCFALRFLYLSNIIFFNSTCIYCSGGLHVWTSVSWVLRVCGRSPMEAVHFSSYTNTVRLSINVSVRNYFNITEVRVSNVT